MNKMNEQRAGRNGTKPSFQSQSLGPNKVAHAETPTVSVPEPKPELKIVQKPEVTTATPVVLPEVAPQVTDKPVPQVADKPVSKPMLEKAS